MGTVSPGMGSVMRLTREKREQDHINIVAEIVFTCFRGSCMWAALIGLLYPRVWYIQWFGISKGLVNKGSIYSFYPNAREL